MSFVSNPPVIEKQGFVTVSREVITFIVQLKPPSPNHTDHCFIRVGHSVIPLIQSRDKMPLYFKTVTAE